MIIKDQEFNPFSMYEKRSVFDATLTLFSFVLRFEILSSADSRVAVACGHT